MKLVLCPYCGELMDPFDYELTGGHRRCLEKAEEEEYLRKEREEEGDEEE